MSKAILRRAVAKARKGGCGGLDVDIRICSCEVQDFKKWLVDAFGAFNIIDWQRDDPHGFGVGRNTNGVCCSGFSFDFDKDITIIKGVVCKACGKTVPPHTVREHEDLSNPVLFCPHLKN